jgi:hypothetical protein
MPIEERRTHPTEQAGLCHGQVHFYELEMIIECYQVQVRPAIFVWCVRIGAGGRAIAARRPRMISFASI